MTFSSKTLSKKVFFTTFSVNDTQHDDYAEFYGVECSDLFIFMLNVIMLSIIMVNVVLVIVMSRIHLVLLINIWGKVFLQTIYQISIYTIPTSLVSLVQSSGKNWIGQ